VGNGDPTKDAMANPKTMLYGSIGDRTLIRRFGGIYNMEQVSSFDKDFNPAGLQYNYYDWSSLGQGACTAPAPQWNTCIPSDALLATLAPGVTPMTGVTYFQSTGGALGIINPKLRNPYVSQFAVNVERLVTPTLSVRVMYVYNTITNDYDLTTPNRPISAYTTAVNTFYPKTDVINDPTGSGTVPLTIMTYPSSYVCPKTSPTCSFNKTMFVNRDGNADHNNSFEVAVTKRTSGKGKWNKFSGTASYDITNYHVMTTAASVFSATTYSAGTPLAPYQQAFGKAAYPEWFVKAGLNWSLPAAMSLGFQWSYMQGKSNWRQDQFSVTNLGTIYIPVSAFGSVHSDNQNMLSFKLAKNFKIRERNKFSATMEFFNLLNTAAATTQNFVQGTTGTNKQYGVVSVNIPPTIARFGLNYKF